MKPVKFPLHNQILGPPPNMTENECSKLPVFTDGKQCVSCWELSDEEIEQLVKTKRLWLGVLSGATQPPVWLSTEESVLTEAPRIDPNLN